MDDIHELRQQYRTLLDDMEALSAAAEAEDRDFTDEERARYEGMERDLGTLRGRITRLENLRAARDAAPNPAPSDTRSAPRGEIRDVTPGAEEFRSLAEFVQVVTLNPRDVRLREQYQEARALEMGVPASGGYLVPEQFMTDVLEFTARSAVVRPRATVIPAGDSPDAAVNIPILDQSGANGVYGGVDVAWIAEGAAKPETSFGLDQLALTPYEVAAHIKVTDKALRNAPLLETLVRRLLTFGINAAEDVAFIQGDGVGKPTGYVGHASNVLVNRVTADTVTYADLVEMLSRMVFGGNPVWVVSQRVLPKLMLMEDTAGQLIWQPSARDGVPGSIFGYDVVVTNRAPALGDQGDVSFVDLSYYVIKDGTGLMIAASEHVEFLNNRTVIKAFKLVDGKPWPQSPLTDENGELVSPFVVLDVPAAP